MTTTPWIQDLDSLLPKSYPGQAPSRRAALKAALGVGYAASVLPSLAQTAIRTPVDGLLAGEVVVQVQGTAVPVYRAAPLNVQNAPVVLVLSEVFGVHEYIADVARRFAQAGYLALAPELFVRQGNPRTYTEIGKLMSEVVSKVPDAQVMADLDACLDWAAVHGGDMKRVGVTGFCWGGRQAWMYTAHQPRIKAAVAWYGRLVGLASELTPRHPIDVVGQLHAPVLGLYGGADTGIPLDAVEKMKAALASGNAAARAAEWQIYPDAPHAFHADYRPSYRAAAAEDGWKRCLAWMARHGVA